MSTIEKAVEALEQKSRAAEDAAASADETETIVSQASRAQPEPLQPTQAAPTASPSPGATVSPGQGARPGSGSVLELPLKEFADAGMVTPFAPRSRIAEEFRAIKRPLLRNIERAAPEQRDGARLIMVTSALQGDGKTFTAINLAMSIAMEQDRTVLFVDADVSKAQAGSMLGLSPGTPGLIDVLENKGTSLPDVIRPTSIPNLRILPAGNVHERSTELLASQSMHDLMLEMSSRYSDRVILFDSPPLLMTTEASVLASFMGQVAFVVSADQTPQEAVDKALESISDDKIIGMILNKSHHSRNKLLGLGYGYGYGYGYGSDRQDATAEQGS